MKYILFIILLASGNLTTLAQSSTFPCDKDCVDKKYPYRGCTVENGVTIIKSFCTSNPNAIPGAIIYRPPMPPCFTYDDSELSTLAHKQFLFQSHDNGMWTTTLDMEREAIEGVITSAFYTWYFACKQDGQPFDDHGNKNNCCVKILWSKEIADVRVDPDKQTGFLPIARTHLSSIGETTCDGRNCDDSYIILNQDKRFTKEYIKEPGSQGDGIPEIFFFAGGLETIGGKVPEEYRDKFTHYNLFNVLVHELGHWIGFPHPYDMPECNDYDTDESVMNNENPHENDRFLSEDDICMFRKLYCCSQTVEVEESAAPITFQIIPNPVENTRCTIVLPEQFQQRETSLKLVSLRGNILFRKTLPAGTPTSLLDLSSVESGIYIVELQYGKTTYTKKLILSK